MKKIKYFLFLVFAVMLVPNVVFGSGSISPSTRSLTINKGGTATFTVSANNAVGKVDISTSLFFSVKN